MIAQTIIEQKLSETGSSIKVTEHSSYVADGHGYSVAVCVRADDQCLLGQIDINGIDARTLLEFAKKLIWHLEGRKLKMPHEFLPTPQPSTLLEEAKAAIETGYRPED